MEMCHTGAYLSTFSIVLQKICLETTSFQLDIEAKVGGKD